MDSVLERIDAWQATGLIDAVTADRLRAAESGESSSAATAVARGSAAAVAAGSAFGPQPTIVEAFAYLGGGFIVAAWVTFLNRLAETGDRAATLTGGYLLSTVVLFGLGYVLRRGDARRRRGAGVLFFLATLAAAVSADFLGRTLHIDDRPTGQVLDAAAAVGVAVAARRLVPAVTTQLALLAAVTGLGAAILAWLEPLVGGGEALPPAPGALSPADSVLLRVVLPAAGWLVIAVAIGALALVEDRLATDPARRRASITRLWAGLLAVLGVGMAAFRSGSLGNGDYGRLLAPWLCDVVLLALAAGLLERAIRRDSPAFLLAAAVALIVALTDVNFTYLSGSRDLGLLIEGAILLAAGFGADRLRRRFFGRRASRAAPAEAAG